MEKTQKEIVSRIDFLKETVKKRGRKPSKTERVEMREEIALLEIELNEKVVKEFEDKFQSELENDVQVAADKVNEILDSLEKGLARFILEPKIERLISEVYWFKKTQQEIYYLRQMRFEKFGIRYRAVKGLQANPKKTVNLSSSSLEDIQRYLALRYKGISSRLVTIEKSQSEIRKICEFLDSDEKVDGFSYLSDALFKEASDFKDGYSIVEHDEEKKYFSSIGKYYGLDTPVTQIPRISAERVHSDLRPFSD